MKAERWIECSECGWNLGVTHRFDELVPPADPQPTDSCPACGEPLIEVVPASVLIAAYRQIAERESEWQEDE